MIIFAILMLLAGIASLVYGNFLNTSLEAKMNALFSSGITDPGNLFFIVGAVLILLGIILIVVKAVKRK